MFVIFGRCREVWLRAKVVGGLFVKFILIKNDWKIAKKSQNVYAKNTKTVGLVIFFYSFIIIIYLFCLSSFYSSICMLLCWHHVLVSSWLYICLHIYKYIMNLRLKHHLYPKTNHVIGVLVVNNTK